MLLFTYAPQVIDRGRSALVPRKDPFELLAYGSKSFGHIRCSIHHESPDEIILHHARRMLIDDFRGIGDEIPVRSLTHYRYPIMSHSLVDRSDEDNE